MAKAQGIKSVAKPASGGSVQPRPKRPRPKPTDDPEEKTERYLRATSGAHGHLVTDGLKRVNRLKALIEPKTEAMVKVMMDIAEDDKVHPSVRLEAASRVLDRAYGKPKEHVQIDDDSSGPGEGDEIMKLLNNILENVGAPKLEGNG